MVKSMLREDPKRHKATEPAQTVHWSANDMKVAYFQLATPSRNVTQKREWNGFVRSTKEATEYIQELDIHVYVTLVEDSPSVLSLGRLYDELGCSKSWQTGGDPTMTKDKKTITCCIDNFVPLVAVTHQNLLHLPDTTPRGEILCQVRKWRKQCSNCWNTAVKD